MDNLKIGDEVLFTKNDEPVRQGFIREQTQGGFLVEFYAFKGEEKVVEAKDLSILSENNKPADLVAINLFSDKDSLCSIRLPQKDFKVLDEQAKQSGKTFEDYFNTVLKDHLKAI